MPPRRATTGPIPVEAVHHGKKVRVTGPFTVESVSPHRTASFDADVPVSEQAADRSEEDATSARSTTTCLPPACRTAAGPSG